MRQINILILCLLLISTHLFSQEVPCFEQPPTQKSSFSFKIQGVVDNSIRIKNALGLDSIRIFADDKVMQIDSFKVLLYNDSYIIDTFNFHGNTAQNVFRNYGEIHFDKFGSEYFTAFDIFIVEVFFFDKESRVHTSQKKVVYFSLLRKECFNGSMNNKKRGKVRK